MTRKQFIESHGATCSNWQFSWSFLNKSKRLVIFGAWDINTNESGAMIFDEKWATDKHGRKRKGYDQSRGHIRLIEDEGYRLMTFPMHRGETEDGNAKIDGFTAELTEKTLIRGDRVWYAANTNVANPVRLAEELPSPDKYPEGGKVSITINAYERNPKARAACIAYHGCKCAVCGFNFGAVYGSIGEGFIHVHHIIPVGKMGGRYDVNPKTDLVPVCPNCHAMIHKTEPALKLEQLRARLTSGSD